MRGGGNKSNEVFTLALDEDLVRVVYAVLGVHTEQGCA